MVGFISRSTRDFRNTNTLKYLYYALIRSTLEYGCVIWSPYYKVHIDRIEKVQKQFLNILCYRLQLGRNIRSYFSRLKQFNIPSLSSRRKCSELVTLYKIVHSHIDCPSLLSLLNFITRYKSRNPSHRLFQLEIYKNNTSFYNPVVRMCRLYNDVVAEHPSLDIFGHTLPTFKNKVKDAFKLGI